MEETAGGNLVHPGLTRLTQVSAKLDQALRPLSEHGRQLLKEGFSSFFVFLEFSQNGTRQTVLLHAEGKQQS